MKDLEFGIPEGYIPDKTKTTDKRLVFTYVKKCSDITERVKTFEDALEVCKELNIDHSDIIFHSCDAEDETNHKQLKIITMALNQERWQPDFTSSTQKKMVSLFQLLSGFRFFGCDFRLRLFAFVLRRLSPLL